jgi:hypothetical protein
VKVIKGLQTSVSCFQTRSFVLQLLFLGVKFAFFFDCFFSFIFRFDCYEGCIVYVTFAYASLVFIHTKKIIGKDNHYVVSIIIHSQTIKDIFLID